MNKRSFYHIYSLYKQAALLLNKKGEWKDLEDRYIDPEDDERTKFTDVSTPEERMEYYLGGNHPTMWDGEFDDPDLDEEDFELKEPAVRFDPQEHKEMGGSIYGKDKSPYIETEEGKFYDIMEPDEDIIDEENREPNTLDEIISDVPDYTLTDEDWEYLKSVGISDDVENENEEE